MKTRQNVLRIIACLCLTVIVTTLFLPYFESFDESIIHRPLSIITERPNPHQGGHFGGGYYTTYNGFGSLTALFNSGICVMIVALILSSGLKKSMWRIFFITFIISQAALYLEMIAAPFALLEPATMLTGYYFMMLSEILLFIVASRIIIVGKDIPNPKFFDDVLDID